MSLETVSSILTMLSLNVYVASRCHPGGDCRQSWTSEESYEMETLIQKLSAGSGATKMLSSTRPAISFLWGSAYVLSPAWDTCRLTSTHLLKYTCGSVSLKMPLAPPTWLSDPCVYLHASVQLMSTFLYSTLHLWRSWCAPCHMVNAQQMCAAIIIIIDGSIRQACK